MGLGDNRYARPGSPGFDDPLPFKDLNAPVPRKIDQRAHRGFRVQDCAAWIIDTISESAAAELRKSRAGLPAVELFAFEPQRSHRFIAFSFKRRLALADQQSSGLSKQPGGGL